MDTTQHSPFFGDSLAARVGTRVMDAGALPIAHDVRLLEELLKRRKADLHAAVYDAVIGNGPDAEWIARRFGVDLDEEGGDPDPQNNRVVYPLMESIIRGEDPRVAIERRFVDQEVQK